VGVVEVPNVDRTLRRSFPAEPVSVGQARAAVATWAAGLGADHGAVADIKLAVTEAVTNAVVHAYTGSAEDAVVEIDARPHETRLRVVVRDYGRGLVPDPINAGLGLGLKLIATLADGVDMRSGRLDCGTEVDMLFDIDRPVALSGRRATSPTSVIRPERRREPRRGR
jgi:anti-sigma regulatory factor (Ser/Thr protein kinase)